MFVPLKLLIYDPLFPEKNKFIKKDDETSSVVSTTTTGENIKIETSVEESGAKITTENSSETNSTVNSENGQETRLKMETE